MSSPIPVQKSRFLKTAFSLCWNASDATVNPNHIMMNLEPPNWVLHIVRNEVVSSSSLWQHPLLKSTMVNILFCECLWCNTHASMTVKFEELYTLKLACTGPNLLKLSPWSNFILLVAYHMSCNVKLHPKYKTLLKPW